MTSEPPISGDLSSAPVSGPSSSGPAPFALPAFGVVLRDLRQATGLTQEELADRSGLSARAIGGLERGRIQRPQRKTLALLAGALNLSETDSERLSAAARPPRKQTLAAAPAPAPPASAAAPADPRPGELPADLVDFTGRGAVVKHLIAVLSRSDGPGVPVCVVSGPGGIGKSALAVHTAHRLRDRFPDGQLYAALRGTSASPPTPSEVLARFLRALGVDGARLPSDDDERGSLFRSLLVGRQMLVVLDDAAGAAQVRPLIPGDGGSAVLVTSRTAIAGLDGGERVALDALDDAEAGELLTRIVGADRVTADLVAASDVVRTCAGLPLALRIAAVRAAGPDGWSLRTLADRLSRHQRLDLLTLEDRAVRSTFSAGLGALSPSAARAFRLFSGWEGPSLSLAATRALLADGMPGPDEVRDIAAEISAGTHGRGEGRRLVDAGAEGGGYEVAAESAADSLSESDESVGEVGAGSAAGSAADTTAATAATYATDAAIAELTAFSMLEEPVPGRHRFHDLVREFAQERAEADLPPGSTTAAMAGLFRWFEYNLLTAVPALFPHRPVVSLPADPPPVPALTFDGYDDALAWLEAEHTVLVSAVEQAARLGLHDLAWRLALPQMAFFNIRKLWADWVTTHEIGLASVRIVGDVRSEHMILNNLAIAYQETNRVDEAIECLETVLAGPVAQNNPPHLLRVLTNLGMTYSRAGRPEAAATMERALAICREVGDTYGESLNLGNLALLHKEDGRLDQALPFAEAAVETAAKVGDPQSLTLALNHLAELKRRLGHPEEAVEHATRSLHIAAPTGNRDTTAVAHSELAKAHIALGDPASARTHLTEALALFDEFDAARADDVRGMLDQLGG